MSRNSCSVILVVLAMISVAGWRPDRSKAEQADTGKSAAVPKTTRQVDGNEDNENDSKAPIDFQWLPFPDDARFKVLGLPWFKENNPKMWRMPKDRYDDLPSGVKRQCKPPSGGRLLIRSDTANLALKVATVGKGSFKGFDVYINGSFLRSAVVEEPGDEKELVLFRSLDNKPKEIMIYLPCHQEVTIKAVGADRGAKFSPPEHAFSRPLPVVFYGSSVCQGSGAMKPGMTYEAILGRRLNLDFVNLGFGGAGKAEKNVVELVSSIPACLYVFDLGKSYGMQDKTAYRDMLKTVRTAHPAVPILCITPITSALEVHSESYAARSKHTREVMREAVRELIETGEKNLILIEGTDLLGFEEHDGLSKDGVHPTDHGFSIIAEKLLPVIEKVINHRKQDR